MVAEDHEVVFAAVSITSVTLREIELIKISFGALSLYFLSFEQQSVILASVMY